MEFRLAAINELSSIKMMYKKVVDNMCANGLEIWDDIYPVDFLENDIINKHLYILCQKQNDGVENIVSAMCLSNECLGEKAVQWMDNSAKAMYIDRFAVNVDYLRRGYGAAEGMYREHVYDDFYVEEYGYEIKV